MLIKAATTTPIARGDMTRRGRRDLDPPSCPGMLRRWPHRGGPGRDQGTCLLTVTAAVWDATATA
jgi:hypothetical protein